MNYTLAQIEKLLDSGNLEAEMNNGRYWTIRRNGATKTWKRDAARFRIPIKAGLRACGSIETLDIASLGIREKKA